MAICVSVGEEKIIVGNVVPLRKRIKELEKKLSELETPLEQHLPVKWKKTYTPLVRTNCPECGLPYGQCDPEGVGHYRG